MSTDVSLALRRAVRKFPPHVAELLTHHYIVWRAPQASGFLVSCYHNGALLLAADSTSESVIKQMETKLLSKTSHRPWPLPSEPWVMAMRWHDLLFLHWPVRPEVIRPLIPPDLELDTFDGSAWIGVVPFRLTRVRPRHFPSFVGLAFWKSTFAPMCGLRVEAVFGSSAWTRQIGSRLELPERGMGCPITMPELIYNRSAGAFTIKVSGSIKEAAARNLARFTSRRETFTVLLRERSTAGSPTAIAFIQ